MTKAHSSTVTLQGEYLLSASTHTLRRMRRHVQMIFQDLFASLNPRMRIRTTIAEIIIQHGPAGKREAREKAAALLERVELVPNMMRAHPHEFSGEQRQRIANARDLALNP